MNCDRCGKPSVYHSTLIVNGVSQSTNLCRDCAIKEGVFNNEPSSLFDDMFSIFTDILPFEKVKDVVCPVCKTSLKEFKTTNRLGCPNCYEVFRTEIGKIMEHIAPNVQHKPAEIAVKTKKAKETKQDKIIRLKAELKQAVEEERYEDAGKLKKQIQALESKDE